jgi:hypothetical protein
MRDLEELFGELRSLEEKIEFNGAKSEELVTSLETALGVKFPPSYRQFLLNFGGAFLTGNIISGIYESAPLMPNEGSTFGDTQRYREVFGMPNYLIVVAPDEDAPYCLDSRETDENGEMPVVCYTFHTKHIGVIAESFEEYLIEWFLPLAKGDTA